MSVLDFVAGALFSVRVTKNLTTNPDDKWVNSYEFQATDAGTESELLTLGTAVANFESEFHHNVVIFDRILISTWAADSVPYNPATFISSTLTLVGQVGAVGGLLALNTCLSVTRQAASGRFGHLFYRGVLEDPEVTAPSGKTVLVSRANQQTKINDALTASGLDEYLGADPAGRLELVMINAGGTQVRKVTQLFAQGVSTVPLDHAWFNRTSP